MIFLPMLKLNYFIIFNHEKRQFHKILILMWEKPEYGKNLELLGSEILTESQFECVKNDLSQHLFWFERYEWSP